MKISFKLIVFSFFLLLLPSISLASFLDEWYDQKTTTDAQYFEGQKRNYFTAGGFNVRWKNSNDYLVTLEPPRVKAGCGGIDVFMGGFSFMNTDYLVQKLQRIMQNAPAAAFDIAFNTLCTVCANTMKSMEAISDSLNSIQLNDCKAAKAVAVTTLKSLGAKAELRGGIESEFAIEEGLQDMKENVTKYWKANDSQPGQSHTQMISGCGAQFKEIFADTSSSIVANMLKKKGYSDNFINFARGIVGDVLVYEHVNNSNGNEVRIFKGDPVSYCKENAPGTLKDILNGTVYEKKLVGGQFECSQVEGAKSNLSQWIQDQIFDIRNRVNSQQELTADQIMLIRLSPVPIYSALKIAVSTGQESILYTMSDTISKAFAYNMMADIHNEINKAIYSVDQLYIRQGETKQKCKTDIFADVLDQVKDLQGMTRYWADSTIANYQAAVTEISTINSTALNFSSFDKLAKEKLIKLFGVSVTKRALGK